jgi:hypothetical protein
VRKARLSPVRRWSQTAWSSHRKSTNERSEQKDSVGRSLTLRPSQSCHKEDSHADPLISVSGRFQASAQLIGKSAIAAQRTFRGVASNDSFGSGTDGRSRRAPTPAAYNSSIEPTGVAHADITPSSRTGSTPPQFGRARTTTRASRGSFPPIGTTERNRRSPEPTATR